MWEIVETIVKDRLKLASILASSECLEFFQDRADLPESKLDHTFQARHKFAAKLSPLPVTLDSKDAVALLLQNFPPVDERERNYWIKRNPLTEIVDVVYNNPQIINSGTASQLALNDIFDRPDVREKYFAMLKNINDPLELFGHAAYSFIDDIPVISSIQVGPPL